MVVRRTAQGFTLIELLKPSQGVSISLEAEGSSWYAIASMADVTEQCFFGVGPTLSPPLPRPGCEVPPPQPQ